MSDPSKCAETKAQSSERPAAPITPDPSAEEGSLRGLKIPVSAVRFRPWARVNSENDEKLSRAISGVLPHCAESQSSGRPHLRRANGGLTLDWLLAQTAKEGACLVWRRSCSEDGYGRLSIKGKDVYAHRVAFELARGPVFCWLVVDHLCRNRACINPDHLEAITQAENTRRGTSPSAVANLAGACPLGHELTAVGGRARCKVCQAERQREWYQRKRAGQAGRVQ